MVLPEQIEQNVEGQRFLILTNRISVWPVNHLYHHRDENGCQWNPVQIESDYRFSRSIKERLKRQRFKPLSYSTNSSPYYPHTFVSANYSDLLKLRLPNTSKLPGQQVEEMRNWRAVHGQSVPKKLRNRTNRQNPVTIPINLYAVAPPDDQPLDLTKLGDHHWVQHITQKEVTEISYTSSQIVRVKVAEHSFRACFCWCNI